MASMHFNDRYYTKGEQCGKQRGLKQKKNDVTCPMQYTMNKIAGKWKLVILWHIYDKEIIRYGELKRCLNNITHKMLSNQLKALVSDNIVHKKMYHQIPPKVEYSLTEHGKTLIPIMDIMFEWGAKNRKSEEVLNKK